MSKFIGTNINKYLAVNEGKDYKVIYHAIMTD